MTVVTLTAVVTISGLVLKIKSLRHKISNTDTEVDSMLDGVVDILAQLQKMEEHGTRLRSNELDENIRRVYELRNQLERYMTRNVVAKAFRQSKTRMYLSDLETTLESLATLHEGLCQHKTEENLRRLNVLAQSLCEAMEEMAVDHDFELSVSSPSVAPSHSFKATPRAPKVKSIMMSTFSRFNAAAFASVSQPEHADLNLNVSTNQGGDSDQQITMQYVEMLESGGDNEKSEALWSLNQISKHTSCTMNASRVAAALVAAMKHSSTLHRLLATRVLRNLAKIALVDEDVLCAQAIPALLDSLDAHNDRVILEATSTLLVLAQSCTLQTEIVAAGGLEKLVTIAKQPRWGRVTATVLAALCALVRRSPTNLEAFKALQGIEVIVHIVCMGTEEETVAACCALRRLMASFPGLRSAIESADGIESLTKRREQGTANEQEAARKTLQALLT